MMGRKPGWLLFGAIACLTTLGCGNVNDDVGGGETTSHTREALTQNFTLPVPVGFTPQDIVVGAIGVVNLNDNAKILTHAPGQLSQYGNVAAFGSPSTTSNIGALRAGVVWSRPSLLLRQHNQGGANIEFYKTEGTATEQLGFVIARPEENRTQVQIRRDPIWTVPMSAPDGGMDHNVNSGETVSLGSGNYGRWTVNSGGTLILTGSTYGFVELNLNSGGTVQLTSSIPPWIFVRDSLIVRATLNKPGMVVGYLGTSTVPVEYPFYGDLLLAPNADIEVKSGSQAHFFGKDVTVFEAVVVDGPPLSERTQGLVRPLSSIGLPAGLIDDAVAAEISSAVLTSQLGCGTAHAFVSHYGNALMDKLVSDIGTTNPASFATFPTPAAPGSCTSLGWLPGETPAWPALAGGTPSYDDTLTVADNALVRMSGGRLAQAGLAGRTCVDPSNNIAQGPNCPGSQPTAGDPCNPSGLDNKACIYGTTQCQCLPTACKGLEGASCFQPFEAKDCCSESCSVQSGSNVGTCTAPDPMQVLNPTWSCGPLERVETATMSVRIGTSCGSQWTSKSFDPVVLGMTLSDGIPVRDFDRQEMYWDNFDDRLYLNVNSYAGFGGGGSLVSQNFIYSASAAGINNAVNLAFQPVLPQKVAGDDDASGPRVMTTVLDEKARLTSNPVTFGRYVHLVTARCFGTRPQVQIYTPFGRRTWDLNEGDPDVAAQCRSAVVPYPLLTRGPGIAAVSSVPPRVRIAYTGVDAEGSMVINVYSATILSGNDYADRPLIVREHTVHAPSSGRDTVWPNLIGVDGLAGSDRQLDSPMVLRWLEFGPNDMVSEKFQVLYSGLAGPEATLQSWTLSDLPAMGSDYRYGSFFEKSGGELRFFTPWTGVSRTSMGQLICRDGNNTPIPCASGGFVDVTPKLL